MITEDKFGLRPIWDASLEIYREISKICERHRLRYYATDGSALGAVRHGGFIPWDDDLDMSMPRPDYEKFIEYAKKELPQHLRFWNYHDDSRFIFLFGKVQEIRSDTILSIEKKVGHKLSNGLFVDIFPIDGYPESALERFWLKISTSIAASIVRFKCTKFRSLTKKGRIAWILGLLLSVLIPWSKQETCLAYCEKMLKRHPFDSSRYTGRACSFHNVLRRKPLSVEVWGRPTAHEFDNTEIMIPENADAHLRNEYYKWDYMQLPPEKDQHPTHSLPYHFPWWLGPTNG